MKHYLDLIPISAGAHKKQSRMSVCCIVLAVFLVTGIFGMADMFIRSQILQARKDNGNWHVFVKDITWEEAALMEKRTGIEVFSPYGIFNYRADQGYTMGERYVAICGSKSEFLAEIYPGILIQGTYPQNKNEALVTDNAREMMGLQIGDIVTVEVSGGEDLAFTICGFANTTDIMSGDFYGILLDIKDYQAIYPKKAGDEPADQDIGFFIRFADTGNIQREISDLKSDFGLSDEQVSENTKLLGLLGQSRDSFMIRIYWVAAVLAVLVLFAGIMMIASSLNSNVAQRTEFFGLMRCIGATPKQVMRMVHKEAFRWCRFAIPAGVGSGIVMVWILCAVLRFLSPEFFGALPVFGVSMPSVAAGIIVGLLTVFLAARAPAKRAAKVSPLAAVSGGASDAKPVRKAANTKLLKIDTALGIHHASASRKNLCLMTGSFALSIILFLAFSVTIDFMHHALTPLRPWTADLSIVSPDNSCSVDEELLKELRENPVVKAAYGRRFAYELPLIIGGADMTADLISYEEKQFGWAKEYLIEGSLERVQEEPDTVLLVYDPQNPVQVGDIIQITADDLSRELLVAGLLSECPFDSDEATEIVICSENTFQALTGESGYTIIDVQLTKQATDEDVNAIHRKTGTTFTFKDERMGNSSVRGAYYCFCLFVYGFLVLIAMITVFNVVNSIALSVAARMKQYGAFRAIGLSSRQLSKMVAAEAFTYAGLGGITGTVLGLAGNKFLFEFLITDRWNDSWTIPLTELEIIILILLISVLIAIHGPVQRLRRMSIIDTISEQ